VDFNVYCPTDTEGHQIVSAREKSKAEKEDEEVLQT
jgi:hypothetical protein